MDPLFGLLTAGLQSFMALILGSGAEIPVVGTVTRGDCAVVIFYLAMAVLVNIGVAAYVRRRLRASHMAPAANLRGHFFAVLGRPLYILIWCYGIYLAVLPILTKLTPGQAVTSRGVLDYAFDLGAFMAVVWFLLRLSRSIETHAAVRASQTPSNIDDLLVPLVGSSLRIVLVALVIILGLPMLGLPPQFGAALGKVTSIVLILSVATLLFRAVALFERVVLARFDMTVADNLRARKVYTQLHVISRVIYITIGVFTVSAILMLFQEVRHVGTSLLASAGIVGVIAGFAAQKTLANLFAGFQLALAQPVRQDDVVVVEGEWGRVEEITLTYVIVHIWDDRRLVLPLSYFIEKPFQNWTRTSAAIMGSVFVWVDYSFPVDAARTALKDIIEDHPLWDRRFWNLQVSDSTDKAVQLRVLATSSDSSRSWDLRCEIREKLIAYIQQSHPAGLPRVRADVLQQEFQ